MAFYRGTVGGHLEGGEIWNITMHFRAVTGQAAAMAVDLADAVTLMWSGTNTPAGNLTALYPAAIGVDRVVVDELDPAGRNVSQGQAALALVGTGTTEPLPPQCSPAVSLRSNDPTRAGRGRFYLPSPVVDTVIDQRLDSAAQTDILNGALAMLEHMNGLSWAPTIYHRGGNDGSDITSIDVSDIFDVQRRRRNKLVPIRIRHNLS